LILDAPSVVARYFPEFPGLYARAGWTMFQSIDRVYDSAKAYRTLGFQCRVGFNEKLKELQTRLDLTAD
jgi:UDP-glucose 4-epimerase